MARGARPYLLLALIIIISMCASFQIKSRSQKIVDPKSMVSTALDQIDQRKIYKRIISSPGSVGTINKRIQDFFSERDHCPSKLRDYLQSSRESVDYVHVLTVMYKCSKLKVTDLRSYLNTDMALEVLERAPCDVDTRTIATALYSLNSLTDSAFSRRIIRVVTRWLEVLDSTTFSGQEIAMSLFGLQQFSDTPEIVNLLRLLLPKLQPNVHGKTLLIRVDEIAIAIYGFQNMVLNRFLQ